ncbi:F-box domain containing protein [Carex littledalei]|uniref:F-box domain containing protein n=1 Tax=Carex littledalei TaxID=544730 RepID=A0A833RVD2_9POAL|nr:F-box domain containing protein [Carex littledalei]
MKKEYFIEYTHLISILLSSNRLCGPSGGLVLAFSEGGVRPGALFEFTFSALLVQVARGEPVARPATSRPLPPWASPYLEKDAMDWFSSLPDEILPKILSFLSTKEAVQTCILSKRWRNAWTFLPVLKFSVADYWVDGSFEDDKFNNFLSGVLENRYPIKLDVFEYTNAVLNYDSEISFEFIDGIGLEPRKAVVIVGRDRADLLDYPEFVFSCTKLENLDLRMKIADALPIRIRPELVHLPALKFVDLTGIALVDDCKFTQNLCSKCPVLETMVLRLCDLDITEISSKVLKELTLYSCSQARRTQISCPSLASLVIESYEEMEGFELKNMTSLKYAKIFLYLDDNHGDLNLSSLSNVSHLSLGLLPQFKEKLEKDICDCSKAFRNLRHLEIDFLCLSYDIDLVACFLKQSPFLEELTLHLCEPEEDDPEEEISQEELGNRINVLFQREHLKTLRIVKPKERPDLVIDTLMNNLRTHIKTIGEEIIMCET